MMYVAIRRCAEVSTLSCKRIMRFKQGMKYPPLDDPLELEKVALNDVVAASKFVCFSW